MYRVIRASSGEYDRNRKQLQIPTYDEYMDEVTIEDEDIIKALMQIKTFNGKLFSAPSTRNELGKTTNYSAEDKIIHLVSAHKDYRVYDIPFTAPKYPGVTGIYTFRLTVYDDGSFKFGNGKIRRLGDVSDNTLSNDVYKAKWH